MESIEDLESEIEIENWETSRGDRDKRTTRIYNVSCTAVKTLGVDVDREGGTVGLRTVLAPSF